MDVQGQNFGENLPSQDPTRIVKMEEIRTPILPSASLP